MPNDTTPKPAPDRPPVTAQTARAQRATQVLALWDEGQTSGAIARQLGCTRNTVIGLVTRARDSGRTPRRGRLPRMRPVAAPAALDIASPAPPPVDGDAPLPAGPLAAAPPPAVPVAPIAPAAEPPPTGFDPFPAARAMARLTRTTCRWPLGDPRDSDFRFCCEPVTVIGKPYCADHAGVAFAGTVRRLVPTSRHGALSGRAS